MGLQHHFFPGHGSFPLSASWRRGHSVPVQEGRASPFHPRKRPETSQFIPECNELGPRSFIRIVEEFQGFSDHVEVVLLPRNTDWIQYPPEAVARMNTVLDRIRRETGVTIRDYQDVGFGPEHFSDTTHLSRYGGDEQTGFGHANVVTVIDPDPNGDGADGAVVGQILLANGSPGALSTDGTGGQGVKPLPMTHDGWIQKTVALARQGRTSAEVRDWIRKLTPEQRNPD